MPVSSTFKSRVDLVPARNSWATWRWRYSNGANDRWNCWSQFTVDQRPKTEGEVAIERPQRLGDAV